MNGLNLKIIPPFQVLILGVLMWLAHGYVDLGHWHSGFEYSLSRILLVVALLIFMLSVWEFWRHKTTINPVKTAETSSLITGGIFSLSRNPIYLADCLILLAWAIWLGFVPGLIFVWGFIAYVTRFQIHPEETVLREKFGQCYDDYCRRTRRWI